MGPDLEASIENADAHHSRRCRTARVGSPNTVAIQDIDDVRVFVTRLRIGTQDRRSTISAPLHLVRNLRKLGVDIREDRRRLSLQNIARSTDDRTPSCRR